MIMMIYSACWSEVSEENPHSLDSISEKDENTDSKWQKLSILLMRLGPFQVYADQTARLIP